MATQEINSSLGSRSAFHPDAEDTLHFVAAPQIPVKPQELQGTGPFADRGFATIDELIGHPSGNGFPTGDFTLIPAHMEHKAYEPGTVRWWLELRADQRHLKPLRFEIVGDVVVGRSAAADINLDLESYDAMHYGISRRHALLRPSAKALYLLDLGSTNGTHCNGIPMGQGIAIPIKDRYVLRFGKLNMTVFFLAETTM
jgi:hypothetical protein